MAKRRPSGDDMVREKEDDRWEGRIVVGYDEKGLPKPTGRTAFQPVKGKYRKPPSGSKASEGGFFSVCG